MTKEKGTKDSSDLNRICDTCRYDYFCTTLCRPRKTCINYFKVEEGKTSEDYARDYRNGY